MSSLFQSFPNEVLALIVSFASNQSNEISSILECTLPSRASIDDDDFSQNVESIFQALCQSLHAPHRENSFPGYSWKKKYTVLSEWLPREGFYVLLEAAPWGMLLRLKMDCDCFVGDLLWPQQQQQQNEQQQIPARTRTGNVDEEFKVLKLIRVLNVSFDVDGQVNRVLLLRKLKNGITISALNESEAVTPAVIPECPKNRSQKNKKSLRIGTKEQNFVLPPMFVRPEDVNVENPESDRELQLRFLQAQWHPEAEAQGCDLLQYLWQYNPNFTLNMIQKSNFYHPLQRQPNVDVPLIQAGLYSGVYENIYGKFRREIIMVEYHRYDFDTDKADETWDKIHTEIFNTPYQTDDDNLFQSLKDAVEMNPDTKELVFMLGRKATGDYHVPMLKITFGALIYPKISFNAESVLPETFRDQENQQQELRVAQSWDGWGTLALPYFVQPNWACGSRIKFASESVAAASDTGAIAEKFGFVWAGDDPPTVTVLTRVQGQ